MGLEGRLQWTLDHWDTGTRVCVGRTRGEAIKKGVRILEKALREGAEDV